jgi:hypothetical protein
MSQDLTAAVVEAEVPRLKLTFKQDGLESKITKMPKQKK